MGNKTKFLDLIILYLKYRNCYYMKYQKYSYFKNLIKYITCIENETLIRRMFESLLQKNIIQKKKFDKTTKYIFNPYNRRVEDGDERAATVVFT